MKKMCRLYGKLRRFLVVDCVVISYRWRVSRPGTMPIERLVMPIANKTVLPVEHLFVLLLTNRHEIFVA